MLCKYQAGSDCGVQRNWKIKQFMVDIKQGLCSCSEYPKWEILGRKLCFISKLSP